VSQENVQTHSSTGEIIQLNGIKDKIKKLFISTQDEIMVELNEMKDKITEMERTQGRMKVRQDCF
jgi:hypothetical protein